MTGQSSSGRSFINEARISFLALLVSVASVALTFWLDHEDDIEKMKERSIKEVDRIYDPAFMSSLSYILNASYVFLEDEANQSVNGIDRFHKFWSNTDRDMNPDMLIIESRLQSIVTCLDLDSCDKKEIYSRFPVTVYQSMYYLREFVFLSPDLRRENGGKDPVGWWLGGDVYDFLHEYCYNVYGDKPGNETLWNSRHEEIRRAQRIPVPSPCLPSRKAASTSTEN